MLEHAINTILAKFGGHRVRFVSLHSDYIELLFNGWRRVLIQNEKDGLHVYVVYRVEGHEQFDSEDPFAEWLLGILNGYTRDGDGNMRPANRI